jgi:hypothetical protein
MSVPSELLEALELEFPLIGFYDAPDPAAFEPLVAPPAQGRACLFAFYPLWKEGKTLHLTREAFGCGGAGRWLCGVETRSREDFITFLAEDEGLKADRDLMARWVDAGHPYRAEHDHLCIGPLRPGQEAYLKTITFFVNPDQLSILMLAANYHAAPEDPPPVMAPFGAGCMEMLPLFRDLELPQAMIGATDLAMRHLLPPNILAFTCTVPMFERLCTLDERSFLSRPFLARLKKARKGG